MLLAQMRRDRKETHVEYMKYTLEFVFINATRCCFVNLKTGRTNTRCAMLYCQLTKWPHAYMTGRVHWPVRPLVLIYNAMAETEQPSIRASLLYAQSGSSPPPSLSLSFSLSLNTKQKLVTSQHSIFVA